ncbi:hypothetical protein VNO78_18116 [Psophocarpus tetragonolobus]|uniref:Uncharacterized protein n=1 Tax=Psophocarpus tetragonolobus TaxID=3891 RepID=A0AAN9SNV3_PSOTE
MGNQIGREAKGKIVYWDGSVQEFDEPVTVAELMLEHPQQVVVEFHSAVNKKRPTPLAADQKLEIKKTYLMVPVKRGKAVVLSSEDSRRILHSNFFVSSWGCLARLFHAEGDIAALQRKENTVDKYDFSEFIPEERPEYLSRQLSGKGWKPSLDTIKENKVKTKPSRCLFLLKTFFTAANI